MRVFLFRVFAALSFSLLWSACQADTKFTCPTHVDCSSLWVSAQDIGVKQSFFSRNHKPVDASQIVVGDELVSNGQIHLHSGPADWQRTSEKSLVGGDVVEVVGLQTIQIVGNRTQIWLQIAPPGTPAYSVAAAPAPMVSVAPAAATTHDYCLNPPSNPSLPVEPIITPPVTSVPPSVQDVARLLDGRNIICDQYGLIVQQDADGKLNGGDTAQREGWYWFGVWLREHTPGVQRWTHPRKLTFDQVLALLEPGHDGVFYRHPKQEPFNHPRDKEWGFSRDQMVPLVAAMGVWGKQDVIQRLWDALPEDFLGKHSFNGNWRNFLGQDGPNCDEIKSTDCSPTADCSLQVDNRDCTPNMDNRDCSLQVDNRDCSANEDTRNCDGWSKWVCEGEKATQNALYAKDKAASELAKSTQNGLYTSAKATCEASKTTQNGLYVAASQSCLAAKATQNGIYAANKANCELAKSGGKAACETKKAAAYQLCRLTDVHSGDIIGPATVNLFLRALNKDPMSDLSAVFPTIIQGGPAGEGELFANQHIIVGKTYDNKDETGDDLNNIIMLIMSRLRHPSAISEQAMSVYVNQRHHSYGSYMRAYYEHFGADMSDIKARMDAGIAAGWAPDVSPAAGATRWYHRASEGANPQLGTLYQPVIPYYLH